jgi:hypothetical protein
MEEVIALVCSAKLVSRVVYVANVTDAFVWHAMLLKNVRIVIQSTVHQLPVENK